MASVMAPKMGASLKGDVSKVLLIVEDQVILAMMLKDELENVGYWDLELAIRHQEALAYARETKPDFVLVNINLASGDDGVALACDLKALGIPVLFISGQAERALLGKASAIASLARPYSPRTWLKRSIICSDMSGAMSDGQGRPA